MSTLEEILKLLEKIPIWKKIKFVADNFDALESRVAALEAEIKKRPTPEACPICGTGNLKVIKVRDHPDLGPVGIQERTMKCDNESCGHTEKRIHDPMNRMGKK